MTLRWKSDLWFGKRHEEFGEFSPQHSKVSKLGLWWDYFIQSRKLELKLEFTEELCIMTVKNNAKSAEELACRFKIDINWQILTRTLKSFKILHFNGLFLTKVYIVWVEKVQRSYPSWHWRVMQQNFKKSWHAVWKMTGGIWQIFTRALESLKIVWDLMGSFYPK